MRIFSVTAAFLLISAGCSSLPPGDAPGEKIVRNESRLCTEKAISEHLATRLSLFMLANHRGKAFAFLADSGAARIARPALDESAALAGCRVAEKSPLCLYGKTLPDGWEFVFYAENAPVWKETFILEKKR